MRLGLLISVIAGLVMVWLAIVEPGSQPGARDDAGDHVSATELTYEQCREAGGFYAAYCRNYDPEKAHAVVERAERRDERENRRMARGEQEITGSDLTREECREAGGIHPAAYCTNYDPDRARELIGDRNSPNETGAAVDDTPDHRHTHPVAGSGLATAASTRAGV